MSDEEKKNEKEILKNDAEKAKIDEKVNQVNDLNVILDIIGGVRFAIAEQLIKTSDYTNDHVLLLSNYAEIGLELTDSVPFNYTVYDDVANEEVYVFNKSLFKATFSDCDTFVLNRLECRDKIISEAKKILKEPTTRVVNSTLVYEPESVGIDYSRLFSIRHDENEINAISNFCKKNRVEGCFADTRILGDKRVSDLRLGFVNYALNQMGVIMRQIQKYVDTCAQFRSEAIVVLKRLTPWQRPLPLCDPFLRAGVFDSFIRAPQLRYEYIVSIFAPDLKLCPISYADLMRSATVNMTRASYVNDIIQQSYQPAWGESISLYISSWLSIGDLTISYDDSDISASDQELKGVITALLFLASVTFDNNGIHSNTDLISIRKACKRISDWAYTKGLITRPVAPNDDNGFLTPLSNSTVLNRGSKLDNLVLQRIGGMNGIAGASVDAVLPYYDDDELSEFYPGISSRRNVAMDQDDYPAFVENDSTICWPLQDAIIAFLRSHNELQPFVNVVTVMLCRLRHFYVRLNEYMRIAHYSIFRRSEQSRRDYQNDLKNAIVVEIKSLIFVYMCRSWPTDQRFAQKYDSVERVKMQAGFNAALIETALRYRLINQSYAHMKSLSEISKSKILELACKKFSHMTYLYEILKSVRDEKSLTVLLDEDVFVGNDFYILFSNIDMLSQDILVIDGVLPSFTFHYELNRIDRDMIDDAIINKRCIDNFEDFEGRDVQEVGYSDISNAFVGRYLKQIFFSSDYRYYRFKVSIPYQISFSQQAFPGNNLIIGESVDSADLTLRKCLKVSPLTITFIFPDARKYNTPDSYVTAPVVLESAFPPTCYRNLIVVKRSDFIANLYENSIVEKCIIGSNFSFATVLSRETPS